MSKRYLTITALTKYLREKMDRDPQLKNVLIKAEISNLSFDRNKNMYITLKDENTLMPAIMFSSQNHALKFKPENGMSVLVEGNVSVYEKGGKYQLYILDMEPDGIGALYLAYEQLKEKLNKEGLFNVERKRPIPVYPKNIAVITSKTSAAVRDVITTIKRRFSNVQLTIIHVNVQGKSSAPEIVKAIQFANEKSMYDTLILTRGGGSIEDLWSFNEEIVARAIAASSTPVISAVGHETDTTISDLVADLRAPTPTAAGELAVPSTIDTKKYIDQMTVHLTKALQLNISNKKASLQQLQNTSVFHYPNRIINEQEQYLNHVTERLHLIMQTILQTKREQNQQNTTRVQLNHPGNKIELTKQKLQNQKKQMNRQIKNIISVKQQSLAKQIDKLTLLNPLHIMQRGFSITFDEEQKIVKSVTKVKKDDDIQIKLHDGTIDCTVNQVRTEE